MPVTVRQGCFVEGHYCDPGLPEQLWKATMQLHPPVALTKINQTDSCRSADRMDIWQRIIVLQNMSDNCGKPQARPPFF
jgi:hypothetical protein